MSSHGDAEATDALELAEAKGPPSVAPRCPMHSGCHGNGWVWEVLGAGTHTGCAQIYCACAAGVELRHRDFSAKEEP